MLTPNEIITLVIRGHKVIIMDVNQYMKHVLGSQWLSCRSKIFSRKHMGKSYGNQGYVSLMLTPAP